MLTRRDIYYKEPREIHETQLWEVLLASWELLRCQTLSVSLSLSLCLSLSLSPSLPPSQLWSELQAFQREE